MGVVVNTHSRYQDWATRSTAAGVIRAFHFNDTSQLGVQGAGAVGQPVGCFCNGGESPQGLPVIDTSIYSEGSGSMRFDIPTNSSAGAPGQWFANFADDYSIQLAEGEQFFIQWRQRFNQAFIDTVFLDNVGATQGGIKSMIVGTGDVVGTPALSHSDIEIVAQTYTQHRFLRLYNDQDTISTPFEEPRSGDVLLQNAMPAPYCSYQKLTEGGGSVANPLVPPSCFGLVANEFMTFQIGVNIGTWNAATHKYDNSRVRFWGARDGGPSFLLIDWNNSVPGYFPLSSGSAGTPHQKFGKVWLLPYMTNKSTTQVHSTAQTWYDSLIISRNPIADPAPSTPAIVTSYPTWRAAVLTKDTIGTISGTANFANDGSVTISSPGAFVWGLQSDSIDDCWSGLRMDHDGAKAYGVAMGGDHLSGWNIVVKIDFNANAPKGSLVYHGVDPMPYNGDGTTGGGRTPAPANSIFPDGTPRGHQTYDHQFYNASRDAILMFYIAAPFGNVSGHSDVMRAFYLGTNKYDSVADGTGPWGSTGLDTFGNRIMAAMAQDYSTGDVYGTSNTNAAFYWRNDGTAHGTIFQQTGIAGLSQWNMRGSCIDTLRRRWVYFMNGKMEWIDIATPTALVYGGSTTCTGLHTGAGVDDMAYLTYGDISLADQVGWYIQPLYDEFNDRYLLFTGDSNPGHGLGSSAFPGYLWFISPAGVVTDRVSIGTPKNGWNGRAYINRKHKCAMWHVGFTSDWNFMPLVNN